MVFLQSHATADHQKREDKIESLQKKMIEKEEIIVSKDRRVSDCCCNS